MKEGFVGMHISYNLRRKLIAYLMLVPAVFTVSFVFIYPLFNSILTSFHNENLLNPSLQGFVGLKNYIQLFSNKMVAPIFWTAAGNTFYYTLVSTLVALIIGLIIALLVNRPIYGRTFFRSLLLFPWIIPWMSTALLWMWIMDPQWGVLNDVLMRLGFIENYIQWFGSPHTAMLAFIIMNIWKLTPFMFISLLTSLQSLSSEIVESARIDGAAGINVFRYIVLPHLRPTIAGTVLIAIIWAFQAFTPIWIITQGGPLNATTTLSVFLYKKAFYEFDFGMATTIGTVWLIFLILFSFVWLRIVSPKEEIS
jgi:multiple sugar transport system permease protein